MYVQPLNLTQGLVFTLDALPTRLEKVGSDAVLVGETDGHDLKVYGLNLDDQVYLSSPLKIERTVEAEGRSHAFNYTFMDDFFLIGFPTLNTEGVDLSKWWSMSETPSRINYFTLDADMQLLDAGYLKESAVKNEEECKNSCIDWYGSSRPIFTDGRIFALLTSEVLEIYFSGGRVYEKQRVSTRTQVNK